MFLFTSVLYLQPLMIILDEWVTFQDVLHWSLHGILLSYKRSSDHTVCSIFSAAHSILYALNNQHLKGHTDCSLHIYKEMCQEECIRQSCFNSALEWLRYGMNTSVKNDVSFPLVNMTSFYAFQASFTSWLCMENHQHPWIKQNSSHNKSCPPSLLPHPTLYNLLRDNYLRQKLKSVDETIFLKLILFMISRLPFQDKDQSQLYKQ